MFPLSTIVECPRWDVCSASVCPALADWRSHYHAHGERVCRYLLRSKKPGERDVLAETELGRHVLAVADEVCERFPDIAKQVERASLTPRKLPPARRDAA